MTGDNKIINLNLVKSGKSSLKQPDWLATWTADQAPPSSAEELREILRLVELTAEPADQKMVAAALKRIADFLMVFGLFPKHKDDQRAVIKEYAAVLEQLPGDLVQAVVYGATTGLKYHRMPLPSDLMAMVSTQIADRNMMIMRVKTALIVAERKKS